MKRLAFIFLIAFLFLKSLEAAAEFGLIKKAVEAEGQWQKGIILDREVIFTDKNDAVFRIGFDVPWEGDYQLYAYVHQGWREYSPFIYVEAEDSRGIRHTGYMFFEDCWYISENSPGRWLMHSPSATPFWHLAEGELSLKFRVCGKSSVWEAQDTEMQDTVAIETLFLVPVISDDKQIISMEVVEPEFGAGSWDIYEYSDRYASGVISSNLAGQTSYSEINIPVSGDYIGALSIRADGSYRIKISFENGKVSHKVIIEGEEASSLWKLRYFGPIYLRKGKYTLEFKNLLTKAKEISETSIDYLMLIPLLKLILCEK